MYLTFQDYSKLNEWIEQFQKDHAEVEDVYVHTDKYTCRVTLRVIDDEDNFSHKTELIFGAYNMFETYNYNKFNEDLSLLIGQSFMKDWV